MAWSTCRFDADGVTVTGFRTELHTDGRPLIVAIHGGAVTAEYFDLVGQSSLNVASVNGVDMIALNRPNYADSDELSAEETTYARNAAILDDAIDAIWKEHGAGHSGVVVLGQSIGAAIAVHLAASRPTSWPLIGLSISGIHDAVPPHIRDAWASLPDEKVISHGIEMWRMSVFGPDGTFTPELVQVSFDTVAHPVPVAELIEVGTLWPTSAADLAARVECPVQYFAAEYETLWMVDEAAGRTFADYFTGSPRVEYTFVRHAGHCIHHHHAGRAAQLREIAFALDCGIVDAPAESTRQR